MVSKKFTTILDIKVVPSSGRFELKRDKAGTIKCFIKSAPERGLANYEVIEFFAKRLKLPRSAVSIIKGQLSRLKRIAIESPLSEELILEKLGILLPESQLKIQ